MALEHEVPLEMCYQRIYSSLQQPVKKIPMPACVTDASRRADVGSGDGHVRMFLVNGHSRIMLPKLMVFEEYSTSIVGPACSNRQLRTTEHPWRRTWPTAGHGINNFKTDTTQEINGKYTVSASGIIRKS